MLVMYINYCYIGYELHWYNTLLKHPFY